MDWTFEIKYAIYLICVKCQPNSLHTSLLRWKYSVRCTRRTIDDAVYLPVYDFEIFATKYNSNTIAYQYRNINNSHCGNVNCVQSLKLFG